MGVSPMFKFPKIEPEIRIVDLPGEEFEVACRDAGGMFVLLELGAENEFAFYDYPKGDSEDHRLVLTGSHRLKVARRIHVDDFEMFEIESWYAEAGSDYSGRPDYWNYVLNDSGLRAIAEIDPAGADKWTFKQGTRTPSPTVLRPGLRTHGREPLYYGKHPDRLIEWLLEVVEAAQVSIGPKTYRCLKVYWASWDEEQNTLAEYYVADTGRTVFFRRYNGPTYRNYEELAGNPTLEYEGTAWRHWYDCIPDHALITDVY